MDSRRTSSRREPAMDPSSGQAADQDSLPRKRKVHRIGPLPEGRGRNLFHEEQDDVQ